MAVLGIIAEYNPFHNGHRYHLGRSRELCSADYALCVMSGNFIQRGEPAVVDKWARAEMALRSGIDLVIELPVVYAMSSAEFFAYGAVKILDSLGVVDFLSFGSESGDLELLDVAASVLSGEPEAYKIRLKDALNRGISYPAARQAALRDYLPSGEAAETLSHSNNILGVEYMKALKKLSSSIEPLTVPRISSSYNSQELTGGISSATAIRRLVSRREEGSDAGVLQEIMPAACADILMREMSAGRGPVFPSHFDAILLSALRRMRPEEIKALPYVSEGLENRIVKAAASSGSMEELADRIGTRRYTRTRIQRILFSALAGFSADDLHTFQLAGGPAYIRILGFNEKGRSLLSLIKKKATLPILMKTADRHKIENPLAARMMEIEAAATDQYVLAFPDKAARQAGQDFTRNVIRL